MSHFKSKFGNGDNKGVSLLELLVYVAILSGLIVIVSDAFIMLSKGRGQSEARSEVNSAVRFSAELMKQDIKNASSVVTPLLGVPSNSLVLTVAGSTVLYDVVGGILRRTTGVGAPEAVTGVTILVDMPVFTRLENYNQTLNATSTAVQVVMTMRYSTSSSDWAYSDSIRTTVSLR